MPNQAPKRRDNRIIIHFDYGGLKVLGIGTLQAESLTDCFYAAVFERENPSLAALPLAVQQKQIIVTCNYEARRRGLYKLQLVQEAKKKCPDVIIVLGEELTRFRNASKDNYNFLRNYTWSDKVERLGFDEVFLDVTDLIEYNMELLNRHDLPSSFFHLSHDDPVHGFSFDATSFSGHLYPPISFLMPVNIPEVVPPSKDPCDLLLHLILGSHLAQYLRHQLEEQKGYTSTVGISTNKLLSKLVGNVNKPKGQTTLVPPYVSSDGEDSNVHRFIDEHDIGKIPGIGFKSAQTIRHHALNRPATFGTGLVYGCTRENVKVRDVRLLEGMGPELLNRLLAGPGTPKDLGEKIWGLVNGVDDSVVAKAKAVPQQISIEDSYFRLDQLDKVKQQMALLARRLIVQMRTDLTFMEDEDGMEEPLAADVGDGAHSTSSPTARSWLAFPRTLRLSTRTRPPLNADGSRSRNFTRISKSGPMPSFIFNGNLSVEKLAERLLEETLLPLFRQLHPEKSGWNLSLVNICATNMSLVGSDSKSSTGRNIEKMFRNQDDVLKAWKVDEAADEQALETVLDVHKSTQSQQDSMDSGTHTENLGRQRSKDLIDADNWNSEDDTEEAGQACSICGAKLPGFAMRAHDRFHELTPSHG